MHTSHYSATLPGRWMPEERGQNRRSASAATSLLGSQGREFEPRGRRFAFVVQSRFNVKYCTAMPILYPAGANQMYSVTPNAID